MIHTPFNRHQIIAPGVTSHGFMPLGGGQYSISFNGTTTSINAGSDSSIDNLHDGAMTVEAWINVDSWGEYSGIASRIAAKTGSGTVGWYLGIADLAGTANGGLFAAVYCANNTTTTRSNETYFNPDSAWHHVAMTWDDASYNWPRLWIDGTERTTTHPVVRSGAVVSDAGVDLIIGNRSDGDMTVDGRIAWLRISDNIRWTSGFTPDAKDAPPATDGNTVALWTMNEGFGTNVEDVSANSNDGTLSNGSWVAL